MQKEEQSIDMKVTKILRELEIPPHIKGYSYLREAVKLAVSDFGYIEEITKKLYPAIAKKYNSSSTKVERAIRHAIEIMCYKKSTNREAIQKYISPSLVVSGGAVEKVTNSEAIASIADYIRIYG